MSETRAAEFTGSPPPAPTEASIARPGQPPPRTGGPDRPRGPAEARGHRGGHGTASPLSSTTSAWPRWCAAASRTTSVPVSCSARAGQGGPAAAEQIRTSCSPRDRWRRCRPAGPGRPDLNAAEGFAALLALDPGMDAGANVGPMTEAGRAVQSVVIPEATSARMTSARRSSGGRRSRFDLNDGLVLSTTMPSAHQGGDGPEAGFELVTLYVGWGRLPRRRRWPSDRRPGTAGRRGRGPSWRAGAPFSSSRLDERRSPRCVHAHRDQAPPRRPIRWRCCPPLARSVTAPGLLRHAGMGSAVRVRDLLFHCRAATTTCATIALGGLVGPRTTTSCRPPCAGRPLRVEAPWRGGSHDGDPPRRRRRRGPGDLVRSALHRAPACRSGGRLSPATEALRRGAGRPREPGVQPVDGRRGPPCGPDRAAIPTHGEAHGRSPTRGDARGARPLGAAYPEYLPPTSLRRDEDLIGIDEALESAHFRSRSGSGTRRSAPRLRRAAGAPARDGRASSRPRR